MSDHQFALARHTPINYLACLGFLSVPDLLRDGRDGRLLARLVAGSPQRQEHGERYRTHPDGDPHGTHTATAGDTENCQTHQRRGVQQPRRPEEGRIRTATKPSSSRPARPIDTFLLDNPESDTAQSGGAPRGRP